MVWRKILMAVVLAASFPISAVYAAESGEVLRIRSVVIDAGHGGHDPGAIGGGVREKDITLDVAVRLGKKIKAAYPDVNVIFTRDSDVYVPLGERSAIANRNKADLFISVHVNSVGGKPGISGTETFIMGTDKSASNMEVCRTENSVILLEDDYSTKYAGYDPEAPDSFIFFNLMQSAQFEQSILLASAIQDRLASGPVGHSRGIKQAPLLVLWKTTMPSVLVEIGFISNEGDRKIMSGKTSRQTIAECIFNGFAEYKERYEKNDVPSAADSVSVEVKPSSETAGTAEKAEDAVAPARASESTGIWTVQVFSLSKKIPDGAPQMKGEKLWCVKAGETYKYYCGKYKSKFEAASSLAEVRKKFNGAFIVNVK